MAPNFNLSLLSIREGWSINFYSDEFSLLFFCFFSFFLKKLKCDQYISHFHDNCHLLLKPNTRGHIIRNKANFKTKVIFDKLIKHCSKSILILALFFCFIFETTYLSTFRNDYKIQYISNELDFQLIDKHSIKKSKLIVNG